MVTRAKERLADPYVQLRVDPGVTVDELRSAYRRAVIATHPDTGGAPRAFQAVQDAWQILGDPDRRAAYDATRARETAPPPTYAPTVATGHVTVTRTAATPPARRRGRGYALGALVLLAGATGGLTLWAFSTIGRPVLIAGAIYLGLVTLALSARAAGYSLEVADLWRVLRRAAIGLTAAGAVFTLLAAATSNGAAAAVWTATIAAFTGAVAGLWHLLGSAG